MSGKVKFSPCRVKSSQTHIRLSQVGSTSCQVELGPCWIESSYTHVELMSGRVMLDTNLSQVISDTPFVKLSRACLNPSEFVPTSNSIESS